MYYENINDDLINKENQENQFKKLFPEKIPFKIPRKLILLQNYL